MIQGQAEPITGADGPHFRVRLHTATTTTALTSATGGEFHSPRSILAQPVDHLPARRCTAVDGGIATLVLSTVESAAIADSNSRDDANGVRNA
jgi:hypothetical protein